MTGNSVAGIPARTSGCIFKTVSFRTSPQTGVGISPVIEAAFPKPCHSEPVLKLVWESPPSSRLHSPKEGDCHASVRYFIAMTGNSWCGNLRRAAGRIPKNVSFRTSPQTGVGISPVIEAAFPKPCHSEPVLKLVWESPSSSRPHSPKEGDCHASVRYFIAMTGNSWCCNPRRTAGAYKIVNT